MTEEPLDHAARGQLGGKARAAKLSPEERKAIASRAARTRWTRLRQAAEDAAKGRK